MASDVVAECQVLKNQFSVLLRERTLSQLIRPLWRLSRMGNQDDCEQFLLELVTDVDTVVLRAGNMHNVLFHARKLLVHRVDLSHCPLFVRLFLHMCECVKVSVNGGQLPLIPLVLKCLCTHVLFYLRLLREFDSGLPHRQNVTHAFSPSLLVDGLTQEFVDRGHYQVVLLRLVPRMALDNVLFFLESLLV